MARETISDLFSTFCIWISSSVLNERTNAMGSLEDFDIAALLQKVIAFFDGFSSDETEPTG